MCCSWLVLNKPELPSSLPCFARSSGPPYMCLFLFTNCRHEFQMPSWAKGKRTGLASWSPGPRTHWELDRTSVCGSYSWELKTSPSLSLVLRAVPLEEEMATHSSFPAWKTPWTEGPGGLHFMGSQRARHDRATEQRAACLPGRAARCVRRVAPR